MPVYCASCGEPLHRVDKDSNGKKICPNPKCKVAIVGDAVSKKEEM